MSKRENAPTLYQYVKDYIIKLIVSGKYPAYSQLPTEFELMDTLNVGRATVRTALAQLEAEGTIYKIQGVGTFVNERNAFYGLEPFLSLSFSLKNVGIEHKNIVLENKRIFIHSDDDELLQRWPIGTELYFIKRARCAEDNILGIEYNYYIPQVYEKLDKNKLESSLAHNLLTGLSTPICRLDTSTIVKDANIIDIKDFGFKKPEKVVNLNRWMYLEGVESPVNYLHFTMPSYVLELPFLNKEDADL